jgi:cell wall-associated NlpC family hydrolase
MPQRYLNQKESEIYRALINLAQKALDENKPGATRFSQGIIEVASNLAEQIINANPGKYSPNLKATLQALEIWLKRPADYAYTAFIGARGLVVGLDPTDDGEKTGDFKCNRFVGDVFVDSGAAIAYSHSGSGGHRYPTSGGNIYRQYPVSANNIYDKEYVPNMDVVNPRVAKMGDIIAFPASAPGESAHVGIYLGKNFYISAHATKSRYGGQVADGVEISEVKWSQNPRFKRFQGVQQHSSKTNETSLVLQPIDSRNNQVESIAAQRYEAIAEMLEQAGIQRGGSDWNQAVTRTAIGTDLDIKEVKDIARQIPGISPSAADQLVDSNTKNAQVQLT